MPTAIAMPRLGMSMTEGTVLDWPVAIGRPVEKGQTVVLIESEKTEAEVEATAAGFVRHYYVLPDETVPCGTLLGATTATADEAFDAEAFRASHGDGASRLAPAAPAASPGATAARAAPAPAPTGGQARATPAARKLAASRGVDPSQVPGTGPGGRVTRDDVEAFCARRESLRTVAPGVALDVSARGEGETVLLLPGFGADVSAFARQVPALAAAYRTLGVNPRGVGLSDPGQGWDVEIAAADAAAVHDGELHLIGASLGAAIALEIALAEPGRVRSLALLTPFIAAEARLLAVVDGWARLAAECLPATLAAALAPWLFSARVLGDARARRRAERGLAESVAQVPADALARQAAALRDWSGRRAPDLGRLEVRTLVLGGGADLLTPNAESVAAAIPQARCAILPDAGHALGIEAADEVNEALLAHLAAD